MDNDISDDFHLASEGEMVPESDNENCDYSVEELCTKLIQAKLYTCLIYEEGVKTGIKVLKKLKRKPCTSNQLKKHITKAENIPKNSKMKISKILGSRAQVSSKIID